VWVYIHQFHSSPWAKRNQTILTWGQGAGSLLQNLGFSAKRNNYENGGGQNYIEANFSPSFVGFPFIIIIPPLFGIHLRITVHWVARSVQFALGLRPKWTKFVGLLLSTEASDNSGQAAHCNSLHLHGCAFISVPLQTKGGNSRVLNRACAISKLICLSTLLGNERILFVEGKPTNLSMALTRYLDVT
jgi:hypothetical protein